MREARRHGAYFCIEHTLIYFHVPSAAHCLCSIDRSERRNESGHHPATTGFAEGSGSGRIKGGRGAGCALCLDPARITLKIVRHSLGAEASFRMPSNEQDPQCVVGQHVRGRGRGRLR